MAKGDLLRDLLFRAQLQAMTDGDEPTWWVLGYLRGAVARGQIEALRAVLREWDAQRDAEHEAAVAAEVARAR